MRPGSGPSPERLVASGMTLIGACIIGLIGTDLYRLPALAHDRDEHLASGIHHHRFRILQAGDDDLRRGWAPARETVTQTTRARPSE